MTAPNPLSRLVHPGALLFLSTFELPLPAADRVLTDSWKLESLTPVTLNQPTLLGKRSNEGYKTKSDNKAIFTCR